MITGQSCQLRIERGARGGVKTVELSFHGKVTGAAIVRAFAPNDVHEFKSFAPRRGDATRKPFFAFEVRGSGLGLW